MTTETRKVTSSNLAKVTYDNESLTMTVTFRRGSAYAYQGVPFQVFEELCGAISCGSYLNKHIKDNYSYERVS